MPTTQSATQNIPSSFLKKTTYEATGAKRDSFVFDHVPALKELLPRFRGVPGLYYLQCAVQNQVLAQEEGWLEVVDTVIYTIKGPSGHCDTRLYCCGEPIPGGGYQSSKRSCMVDRVILLQTGLVNGPEEQTVSLEVDAPVKVKSEPTSELLKEPTLNASAKPVKKEKSDG